MGKEHRYATRVEKALYLLSRGFCYAPTCKNSVMQIDQNGEPFVIAHIAHICAARSGGPRWDASMTELERKSFPNLILLCKPHHDKVDGRETWMQYPVHMLRQWKKNREAALADQITGLSAITEDDLKKMLAASAIRIRDEMLGALDELKETSDEIKAMLKRLIDEPFSRRVVDPDAVASLENSARALRMLEDFAPILHESSKAIASIEDYWGVLNGFSEAVDKLHDSGWVIEAVDNLGSLRQDLRTFGEASQTLGAIELSSFSTAADQLSGASYNLRNLAGVIDAAERASENLTYYQTPTQTTGQTKRKIFAFGTGFGALMVLAIQLVGIFALKQ